MRVVMYHLEYGIFLGEALGLAFWSKLDPCGQSSAPTFTHEAVSDFVGCMKLRGTVQYVPVMPDDGDYATRRACVAAGLPDWDPGAKPTDGGLVGTRPRG